MKTIHIGSDHAGYELKEKLKAYLSVEDNRIMDHGTHSLESVDYPEYSHEVAKGVEADGSMGILICGSANGVAMAANKHAGIRAAICWSTEIASLARSHNDANVLCLPARYLTDKEAEEITSAFLSTSFEGGRHQRRVSKIACN